MHKTMITLTREEAQSVLDALIWTTGSDDFSEAGKARSGAVKLLFPAIETLRARLRAPEPDYRDVVIKGDLWRIEFLPDHAASVVLVRANYEAQPEPEPVAWMHDSHVGFNVPLYTAPPQREWQGLTNDEILEGYRQSYGDDGDLTDVYFARAIEAKLKEKNI